MAHPLRRRGEVCDQAQRFQQLLRCPFRNRDSQLSTIRSLRRILRQFGIVTSRQIVPYATVPFRMHSLLPIR